MVAIYNIEGVVVINIDKDKVFTIKEKDQSITFEEILETLEDEVFPTSKEELRDLLWCFGIEEAEIEEAVNSCE